MRTRSIARAVAVLAILAGPMTFATSHAQASISGCTLVSGGVDEYPAHKPTPYIAGRIGWRCDGNKAPYAWIKANNATDSGCVDLGKYAREGVIGTYRYNPRAWGLGVSGAWYYCTNSTTKQQNAIPIAPGGGGTGSW